MCEVLDREFESGRAKGKLEGKLEGRTEEILILVHDGDISKERGAERLGITVEELERRMNEKGIPAQPIV